MQETAEKWDGEAGNYQQTFVKGENDYNGRLMDFLASRCGLCPGDRIIDIGCGVGKYGVFFARMGCEVTLTDISPKMLDFAAKNLEETGGKYHIICGDWDDISPESPELRQKFKVAISTMSPAIHDVSGVAKMSRITDGWCLVARFFKWSDPLTEKYCRRLGLEQKQGFMDFEGDCAEMIRCVSAAGYTPLVTYQDYNWEDMRTPEESADRFLSRYFNGGDDGGIGPAALAAARDMADEEGMLRDAVDTKVAWIYWNTNEEGQ